MSENASAQGSSGHAGSTVRYVAALAWGRLSAMILPPRLGRKGLVLLAALVLAGWLATGLYNVQPDEEGIVLRFGRWVATEQPGLHYHLPYPIETVLLPKVTSVNEMGIGGRPGLVGASRMLTGDENIIQANYSVLWKIKDAQAYLFHVSDPQGMVRMGAEAAVREVIGRNPIQSVLSDKRQKIAEDAQTELQRLLDAYQAGIAVIQVRLLGADPPGAVVESFNDVQRARADQERARNEAEAYRNDILPRARGEAERIKQDAEAYKAQVVDLANGEISAYLAMYKVYEQAPPVVARRLYLDSMDEVLRKATRVIVDSSGKGVTGLVPYMPLPDLPGASNAAPAAPPSTSQGKKTP